VREPALWVDPFAHVGVVIMSSLIPVVEAQELTKSYPSGGLIRKWSRRWRGQEQTALKGVSFTIHAGEMVGLLGPNGAGKTTLLKILATMLYPTSGRLRVAGKDALRHAAEIRRAIGVITSDERSFYWRLTGRQNLEFFAAIWDVPAPVARVKIGELLERLSLTHAADQPFYTYSSGMKQKMAIARGLLSGPSILLYDEPTRALDPLSTRNIREWLKSFRDASPEAAHLIATNQMDEAEQLCDRILVLNRGEIVASGSIEEVRARLQKHSVHRIVCQGVDSRLLRVNPRLGLLAIYDRSGGEIEVHTEKHTAALSFALEQILAQGGEIFSCNTVQMSLDEIICSIIQTDAKSAAPLEVGTH
jgi:ABC-2 type transport system ATP-binding protein